MRDELQKYAEEHSGKFKIWHVISDPPKEKTNVKVDDMIVIGPTQLLTADGYSSRKVASIKTSCTYAAAFLR